MGNKVDIAGLNGYSERKFSRVLFFNLSGSYFDNQAWIYATQYFARQGRAVAHLMQVGWGELMNHTKGTAWYVLMSKPRQDAYAEEQLNNQGYTTYRPLAIREKRFRGKMVKVTESLFSRYMFVALDAEKDNWEPIRSTYGVSNFVRFGSMPLSVPASLIENLRMRESQFQERAIDLDRFKQGDVVMIRSGPFEGMDAIFERYSGEERAILLMNILNEQAKVAVSPADLYKTA